VEELIRCTGFDEAVCASRVYSTTCNRYISGLLPQDLQGKHIQRPDMPRLYFFVISGLLLLLSHGIANTAACTDALINDQCSNAVVSARTLSFAAELSPRVTAGKLVQRISEILVLHWWWWWCCCC
jgi:hypothetical protein